MSDVPPRVGCWLLTGGLDRAGLAARAAAQSPPVAVAHHHLPGPGRAGWGELVRGEVGAFRAEPAPARVALARIGPDRHLVVVVGDPAHDPAAVLAWLLDTGAAHPARDPGGHGAGVPAPGPAAALPAELRGGAPASGSAVTLHRACGDGPERFAAALGVPVEAVLATATAVLLSAYRARGDVELLVTGEAPVPVLVDADPGADVAGLVCRVARDLAAGAARPAGVRAGVAVAAAPAGDEARGGLVVTPVRVDDGYAEHDLCVSLSAGDLRLDHDAGAVEPDAAARFADRLAAVLRRVPAGGRVLGVSTLTPGEHAHVGRWSHGDARHGGEDVCLTTLVGRRVAEVPDAVAVRCGDTVLTYGELGARADRVAHRLRARGVGRGDLVVLLAGRSPDSVVGMLGVLASGAAYVPVEPTHPLDRLRRVVRDSGARVVLGAVAPDGPLPAPFLDLAGLAGPGRPCGPGDPAPAGPAPDAGVEPGDLAYVIYTSGSTGTPKGVRVSHRAIVVSTRARAVGGPPPERDLVTMPLCFDGASGGLYWTLTGGGTVVLPTEHESRDAVALAGLARRTAPTHVHSVPSHYDVLLRAAGGAGLDRLRLVSVGGEPMPPELVARHLLECPDAVLLNDYGPTECAVWATAHRCGLGDALRASVSIGGPLPGYRVHVLDPFLRPVPPGLRGEIHIGGRAVADGYHARPALTAERFVPDPAGAPGERLYRTGDVGYWSPKGELHIAGRADQQVKVRGHRVELGEIEAAVRSHRGVGDCAVVVRPATSGPQQVVAAVATTGEAPVVPEDLREHVAALLPDYMVPDRVVRLAALPRGVSGKVDRPALLAAAEDPGERIGAGSR